MTKMDLMEKFKPAFTLTDFVWLRIEVIEELPPIKYPAHATGKSSAKKSARLNLKLDCRHRQPQKVIYRYVAQDESNITKKFPQKQYQVAISAIQDKDAYLVPRD